MSRQYSPKTFLRQIRPNQFRSYFEVLGITPSVDLELLKRPHVDRAFEWMQSLSPEMLHQAETDFLAVSEMASPLGVESLLRAARSRGQDWSKIFQEGNHYERAFFAFLFHREIFEIAKYFEEMDRIGGGRWRRRFVGKGLEPATCEQVVQELARQMRRAYEKEGRGRRCHIDYYRRAEPDRHCFFAYPEDFASSELGYDEKDVLISRPRRPAIEVVFVYRPDDGLLEIAAPGGHKWADELACAFCITVLGLDAPPPQSRLPTLDLQGLLSRDFSFATHPTDGIETVQLRELRLLLPDGRHSSVTFAAKPAPYDANAVLDLIEAVVDRERVNLDRVTVAHAKITVQFTPTDKPRGKSLPFTLRLPEHCTLKDNPHDQIIKRCLRRWGLVRDPSPALVAPVGRFFAKAVAGV